MESRATEKLDAAIDAGNYTEASLIEMRIPLNMPYQERQTEFERHYGEITIEGKLYTYVKMKIDGDVMVLKCIPNQNKQQLKNTDDNLVRSANGQDQENAGKKHNFSFSKIFSGDYDDKNYCWSIQQNEIVNKLSSTEYSPILQDVSIKIPHQPPRC
jgi:hypothetical protein